MQVIGHDDKSIQLNSFFRNQEPETTYNNVLVFIRLQQFLPFKIGRCKKLRVFGYKSWHCEGENI
jgi:hypothetical protein